MRSPGTIIFFVALYLALDFYFFTAIKTITQSLNPKTRMVIYGVYWALTIISVAGLFVYMFVEPDYLGKKTRSVLLIIFVGLFLAKLTASPFFLLDDIRRFVQWVAGKLSTHQPSVAGGEDNISRSVFLSWAGVAVGTTLFGSLIYGFGNKYDYHVRRVKIKYPNLPEAFRGMKLVQISDIHSGSFANKNAVANGVNKINELGADLILFTGDLVNDRATEMDDYKDLFGTLKAPMGIFSTLGNHDYGDYTQWPDENGVTKSQNLYNLQQVHKNMGWRLLMNEHVILNRSEQQIALIGIENWSNKARFPKYGRMDLAYPGTENIPFKILMSHDPSHWEAQVIPAYGDIDLTLSGHTHGMQFGIEIPGFKWSPVQYIYKQWAGLYKKGSQRLYVNRGYGFLGYPGRVGILPEITLIELV